MADVAYDTDTPSPGPCGDQRHNDAETGNGRSKRTENHRLGKSLTDDGVGIGSQILNSLNRFKRGPVDEIRSDNFVSENRRGAQ